MKLEDMVTEYQDLGLELPGFIHHEITVREIALIADLDLMEYMERLDPLWLAAVYPMHHEDIVENLWSGHPLEMLVDGKFEQHCFNFVISATIGWCKDKVIPLNELLRSGNLRASETPGVVLPFVRH